MYVCLSKYLDKLPHLEILKVLFIIFISVAMPDQHNAFGPGVSTHIR